MRVRTLLFTIGLLAIPVMSVTAGVSSAAAGKTLYTSGERVNVGELTAYVGQASIPMSATTLPCVGCHGRDGKGRPEGGVKPSDITWGQLSKAYGGTSKSGRKFGRYDEDAFLRAVTAGVDPKGNRLDNSMPRYNISRHDARRLISYLKRIEDEYDPGITSDAIVFASMQMAEGWQADLGRVITSTIEAYFDDINQQGGVYGRKLQLKKVSYRDHNDFKQKAEETGSAEDVFGLLGSLSGNADQILTEQSESARILSIAPFTNHPTARGNAQRYTFYIYGGLQTQLQVLGKRMLEDGEFNGPVRVLYREGGPYRESAGQVAEFLKQAGMKTVRTVAYQTESNAWLKLVEGSKPVRLLFLGSGGELLTVYPRLRGKVDITKLALPGLLVDRKVMQLPEEAMDKLEFSYHSTPGKDDKLEGFYRFLHKHQFGTRSMSIRQFAYSAAVITVEGLKRAGKRLSREKVVDALEQLFDFDAGLNRPVRFGSSRRIAIKGAYIVKPDKQQNRLISTGDWIELE